MADIIWTDSALNDVERIRLGIAENSAQNAAAFVQRVFAAADQPEMFPRMGRLVPNAKRDDIRALIVDNYRLLYVMEDEVVAILRVRYGAQQDGDIPGV